MIFLFSRQQQVGLQASFPKVFALLLVMAAFQPELPCQCCIRWPCPLALLCRRSVGNHWYRSGAAAASLNSPAHSCLQKTSCSYGTAAAMAVMSYSLRLARPCPASCRCSGDRASRGCDGDGVAAYTVAYKDDSLSTAILHDISWNLTVKLLFLRRLLSSAESTRKLSLM